MFPQRTRSPHTYPIDSNYIKMAVEGNIGEQRASPRLHDVVDICPPFSVPHRLRLVQGNGPSYPPPILPLSLPFTPPPLRPPFLSLSLSLLLPSACLSSLSPFHSSYPPPVLPLSLPFTPPTLHLSFLSLQTSAHPSLSPSGMCLPTAVSSLV